MDKSELLRLMNLTDHDELQKLYDAAYAVKEAEVGNIAYYRGLIEF